jgi:UDP-GlcNAc:undecaprenyl-phosphate GlcNAc-1-phosphate transferase
MVERPLHGRSPFEGDRNHFHHWLHHRFSKSSSLAIYLGLVASTSFAAALAPRFDPVFLVTLAAAYLALMWLTAKKRHARGAAFSVEIVQLD